MRSGYSSKKSCQLAPNPTQTKKKKKENEKQTQPNPSPDSTHKKLPEILGWLVGWMYSLASNIYLRDGLALKVS